MQNIRLPLIRTWLEFEVKEPKKLPKLLFSPLRGVLGAHLKRLSCVARRYETCLSCPLNQHCAYGYLFETPRPKDSERLRLYPYVAHPFVFTPPYPAPESIRFEMGLTLVGRGIQYFPHVILALEAAGSSGLGRHRVPFRLRSIRDQKTGKILYQDRQLSPPELFEDFSTQNMSEAKIVFRTPVSLRYEGKITTPENFAFHIFLRNLLRRLSSLSYFHVGQELDLDFKGLIHRAQEINVTEQNLKMVTVKRYSARKKQVMPLRGLVGEFSVSGELSLFIPLLRAGELVHVGKNTSFGFGYYTLHK